MEAFVHLRPVLAVDGTFITGKFGGTLLTAIGIDAANSLVPLAFALVEKETTPNWRWFLRIVRTRLIGPARATCEISDRHPRIMNSINDVIPGHAPINHRWCMRHFCANFFSTGDLERIIQINEKPIFLQEVNRLMELIDERVGSGWRTIW